MALAARVDGEDAGAQEILWLGGDALERVAGTWRELWLRTSPRPPMLEYEWVLEWWRQHRRLGQPFIVERRVGGRTVGLAPLYVRRRSATINGWLRTVCFLGTGEAEGEEVFGSHLGWLGEDPAAVTGAVARALTRHRSGWDRLWLCNLGPGEETARGLREALRPLVAEVDATYVRNYRARGRDLTEYVETFEPGKHRRELRRVLRAGQAIGARWVRAADLPQARAMFAELIRLHRRQWCERGGRGACASARFRRFHERMLEHYARAGRLWVVGLRARGRWLALHYDIEAGDTLYAYLAGIDPAAGREVAAGKLILLRLFGEAWRAGLRTVELFGGNDEYKRRLTNDTVVTVTLEALAAGAAPRVFRNLRRLKRLALERIGGL